MHIAGLSRDYGKNVLFLVRLLIKFYAVRFFFYGFCFPCDHRSKWTRVEEEFSTYGNGLRSTHCMEVLGPLTSLDLLNYYLTWPWVVASLHIMIVGIAYLGPKQYIKYSLHLIHEEF